jgi:hypothetical protein
MSYEFPLVPGELESCGELESSGSLWDNTVLQEMTEAQTYSWIFYALAAVRNDEGANFRDIEAVADGINHAFPTQKEMASSLRWTESKGLIVNSGKQIFLTDSGREFAARFFERPASAMKTWDRIASAFADMGADNTTQLDCRTMEAPQVPR